MVKDFLSLAIDLTRGDASASSPQEPAIRSGSQSFSGNLENEAEDFPELRGLIKDLVKERQRYHYGGVVSALLGTATNAFGKVLSFIPGAEDLGIDGQLGYKVFGKRGSKQDDRLLAEIAGQVLGKKTAEKRIAADYNELEQKLATERALQLERARHESVEAARERLHKKMVQDAELSAAERMFDKEFGKAVTLFGLDSKLKKELQGADAESRMKILERELQSKEGIAADANTQRRLDRNQENTLARLKFALEMAKDERQMRLDQEKMQTQRDISREHETAETGRTNIIANARTETVKPTAQQEKAKTTQNALLPEIMAATKVNLPSADGLNKLTDEFLTSAFSPEVMDENGKFTKKYGEDVQKKIRSFLSDQAIDATLPSPDLFENVYTNQQTGVLPRLGGEAMKLTQQSRMSPNEQNMQMADAFSKSQQGLSLFVDFTRPIWKAEYKDAADKNKSRLDILKVAQPIDETLSSVPMSSVSKQRIANYMKGFDVESLNKSFREMSAGEFSSFTGKLKEKISADTPEAQAIKILLTAKKDMGRHPRDRGMTLPASEAATAIDRLLKQ